MKIVDELLLDWEEKRARGDPVTPEELCADCPEHVGELRRQIRALEVVEEQFGVTACDRDVSTTDSEPSDDVLPDETVTMHARFCLEKLHATGGLGKVYIAYDSGLNRRVALKFPRRGTLSPAERARFEREALITSRLDHPGIVPVHAFKADKNGQPCYAMRLVDGPTLQAAIEAHHRMPANGHLPHQALLAIDRDDAGSTTFPDGESPGNWPLALRDLLQRFVAVCNIVGYAHRQGVIHRDIKPSNIMLGAFGETMLLDWGLAKVRGTEESTTDEFTEKSQAYDRERWHETVAGQVLGTPAFASPEQLRGETDRVNERSDIYSLGVTLFALLTGSPPLVDGNFADYLEQSANGEIAGPHDRKSSVPRTLDTICRTAMAVDPAARYASAVELGRDIDRFLADEPVSVSRESKAAQAGRWIRKHPGMAAALAATIVVGLFAAFAGGIMLGQKNRQLAGLNSKLESSNTQLVTSNRDLSVAITESTAANAQSLAALRTLVDDVVMHQLSEEVTLNSMQRDFLQKILKQYEASAAIQGDAIASQAIRAEGLMQSGKILHRLSQATDASEKLTQAADIYRDLHTRTGQIEYAIQLAITLSCWSDVLRSQGQLEPAADKVLAGIALFDSMPQATLSRRSWQTIGELHRQLGKIEYQQRRVEKSCESHVRAKAILARLVEDEPKNIHYQIDLAHSLTSLSDMLWRVGRRPEATEFSRQAVDLQRQLATQLPDDPERQYQLAVAIKSQVGHLEFSGDKAQAIDGCTESIEILNRLTDRFPVVSHYREALASARSARGGLYRDQHELKLAEADLRLATEQIKSLLADFPDHPFNGSLYIQALKKLGLIYYAMKQFDAAEAVYQESAEFGKRVSAGSPTDANFRLLLARTQVDYATLMRTQKRFAEARDTLLATFPVFQASTEADFPAYPRFNLVQAHSRLALVYIGLNQPADSQSEFEIAAEMARSMADQYPQHHQLLSLLAEEAHFQAKSLEETANPESATRQLQFEIELRQRIAGAYPDSTYYRVQLAKAQIGLGQFFNRRGEAVQAIATLRAAQEMLVAIVQQDPNDAAAQKAIDLIRQHLREWPAPSTPTR